MVRSYAARVGMVTAVLVMAAQIGSLAGTARPAEVPAAPPAGSAPPAAGAPPAVGAPPASGAGAIPAPAATGELLLGRVPVVTENGRKLAQVGLGDILALVLESNLGLRAGQVGQAATRQSLTAAEERLQPTFTSSLGYARSVNPGLTPAAPLAGSPQTSFFSLLAQNTLTFSAGVTQQDWYGNTYSLNYLEQRGQNQNIAIANPGDPTHATAPANLTDLSSLTGAATLPFAQNSGREFNRIPVGQAQVGLRLSTVATRQQEQTTLNSVAQTYWSLVGQLQTIAVIEQAVRLDEQLVRDNQLRVRAGTRVPSDVLATETQLAVDRRNLLQARLLALTLEDQLRAALGLDTAEFGFQPVDRPTLRPLAVDPQQQLERVYANSPALATLVANLENKGYDLLSAQNAAKPQVNLALSYTFNGFGTDAASAAGTYGDDTTRGSAASLNYGTPLFDRVGPANVQRRLNEQQSLELQIRDQRTSLSIQLQNTLRNIRLAEEQVATAQAAVELAQVQLDNEVKRLQLGSSTPFIVAQLQQQLSQSQQQEIAARVQFEQNEMARLVLTGEVYRQYGLNSLAADAGK